MDYFEKKQWIRIAVCAVLVGVIVLAVTGVFSGKESLVYDPAAKNLPAGAVTAEAAEKGFGGDVTIQVTLDGDKVQELTIDTPNETEGLGKRASEEAFTSQFIGKSGPFAFGEDGIEALSGATITSNAALKAINRAVTGENPAEETKEEPQEETAEEPKEEEKSEPAAAGDATDAAEQGFGGEVTVHVTLDGDKIQALTIDTPNETAGLGQRASEEAFTSQFIGKSGPFTYGEDGIEALTGATITSNAALKAINRAVTGGEPAEETKEEPQEEPAEELKEEKSEPAAAGTAIDAAEQGFGGEVTAHVTLDGDKIQALTIDTPNETAGLGQRASEEAFTSQFIGKSGPFTYGEDGIEALTGATITSNAALKAINRAVAGGEPTEETKEEPKAEEKNEPAAAGTAVDAAEQGFGGEVTAYVTLDGDKIQALTIDTPNETAGLGQRASEEAFTSQFIGKSGPFTYGEDGIEALTGATVTSNAALKAINSAVGGEAKAEPEPAEELAAEPAEEPAAVPETKEESKTEASNGQAYGVYRATKENAFSKVTVTASAKNGELTAVKITSEGEEGKDLLTDAIREEWAKAILESGSAAPDTITGATLKFSAASVQEAMEEILAKMNGETSEKPAAEESSEKPAEEKKQEPESENNLLSLIAVSMGKEQENSYVTDYLEQDPYLVNIYEGYGFAKDYGSARGHYYTLTDVEKTQRPHPKANCLTCKTPDLHKMIEEQSVSVYSMPFDEVMAQMTQPISCYTCHGADDGNGGRMAVTHQYVNEALGANVSEIKAASLSCGQCHIEYYFTPEDSETMMPYHSVAEMTPEAILAYYDRMGFYDWEQPGTGTKMLKAQHPELETWSYGKHAAMLSCADCHMPLLTTESGVQYHDHHLVSPLENDTLLAKCAACHGSAENTVSLVKGIQEKVTARETEVGNKLSALKDKLAAAVTAGRMSEEELDAVRKLHREAQWFFDFCYVENSEGAHNSALAYQCLDTSESKIGEALGLLASAGTPDAGAEVPAEEVTVAEETPAPAEEPAKETAKALPAFAGYRADAENAFSRITIIATTNNGVLKSVKILSKGEEGKDLLTDTIRAEWAKAILESGSATPDAITGATLTYSAGSVQEAMAEILKKAAGE